ncbi:unnamed protein product [Lampetra planeri]
MPDTTVARTAALRDPYGSPRFERPRAESRRYALACVRAEQIDSATPRHAAPRPDHAGSSCGTRGDLPPSASPRPPRSHPASGAEMGLESRSSGYLYEHQGQ